MVTTVLATNLSLAEQLDAGQADLGLALNSAVQVKLLAYLDLLNKWNKVYNLTAIRNPVDMLVQHVLDSLALIPVLQTLTAGQPFRLLDVGSGGGLPGIPVALTMPQATVVSVDPVEKKIAFQQQAKAALKLDNFSPKHARVEQLQALTPALSQGERAKLGLDSQARMEPAFDIITARAFAELDKIVNLAGHLLAPTGRIAAMKGVWPTEEIANLAQTHPEWQVESVPRLLVPGLSAERCVVILNRQ